MPAAAWHRPIQPFGLPRPISPIMLGQRQGEETETRRHLRLLIVSTPQRGCSLRASSFFYYLLLPIPPTSPNAPIIYNIASNSVCYPPYCKSTSPLLCKSLHLTSFLFFLKPVIIKKSHLQNLSFFIMDFFSYLCKLIY